MSNSASALHDIPIPPSEIKIATISSVEKAPKRESVIVVKEDPVIINSSCSSSVPVPVAVAVAVAVVIEPPPITVMARYLALYKQHLEPKGVKPLSEDSAFGQALCCLFEHLGTAIHIDTIREYVLKKGIVVTGGADSLQVRHLALQYGYNMLKGGDLNPATATKIPRSNYLLLDLEKTHPGFKPKRRTVTVSSDAWTALKKHYDNKCVNCGSEEGKPLRWNPYKTTLLQQGHMDPRKELKADNMIPQCAICNQQYKNKAVFNERGFVVEFSKLGFK